MELGQSESHHITLHHNHQTQNFGEQAEGLFQVRAYTSVSEQPSVGRLEQH